MRLLHETQLGLRLVDHRLKLAQLVHLGLLARRIDLEESVKDHPDVLVSLIQLALERLLLLKFLQALDHDTVDNDLVIFLGLELVDLSDVAVVDLRDVCVQLILCLLEVSFVFKEVLLVCLIMLCKLFQYLVFKGTNLFLDG